MILTLGAELDIATGDELAAGVKSLSDKMDRTARPMILNRVGTRLGVGVIDLGSPPTGRVWNILHLASAGSDDNTPVASSFVGLYIGDAANLTLAQLRIPRLVIPGSSFPSSEVLWAYSSESVFVNVAGSLAATQSVVVNVTIAEYRTSEYMQKTGR